MVELARLYPLRVISPRAAMTARLSSLPRRLSAVSEMAPSAAEKEALLISVAVAVMSPVATTVVPSMVVAWRVASPATVALTFWRPMKLAASRSPVVVRRLELAR